MKINSKTRRQFLVDSAKTLVALPLLPSLMPRAAWGQSLPIQKRFIAAWLPLGGYASSAIHPSYLNNMTPYDLYPGHKIHYTNLKNSDNLNSFSKIYSSALNPFFNKITIMRGLDVPIGPSHGEGTFLGQIRFPRGPSWGDANSGDTIGSYPSVPYIDQFLAHSPHFYKTTPSLRAVVGYNRRSLGQVNPNQVGSALKHVGGFSTPHALFNAMFGPAVPVTNDNSSDEQNKSTLIDNVIDDLKSTMNHRNISSTDKMRLDSFSTELHELHNKLNTQQTMSCVAPTDPKLNVEMGKIPTDSERATFLDLYTSTVAAGIKCGHTSVATLSGIMQVGTQGKYSHDNIHGWGHDGKSDLVSEAHLWMFERLYIPLLQKLDVEENNGKTFLDNSIVLWGNENSEGYHRAWDRSMIIAGSAGGYIKNGLFVDYRQRDNECRFLGRPGLLYNQLICTILHAMGIPDSDPMLAQYAYNEQGSNGSWWSNLDNNGNWGHRYATKDTRKDLPLITNG